MRAPTLARWDERFRPWITGLPGRLPIRLYSAGRSRFLSRLSGERPAQRTPPDSYGQTLWGMRFRFPLGNAAGMFKNGEGYPLAAAHGAGFYLSGTTTASPREGNCKYGIHGPFAPFPRSHAASNWLGLPNGGHERVARRLSRIQAVPGCPVGASLAADPEGSEADRLKGLVAGMRLYAQAGVDFLEINESCPNTEQEAGDDELLRRLEFIRRSFLLQRNRSLPVVVKFSNDTDPGQVPQLVDLLLELGFDGVNFGNTSTLYGRWRPTLHRRERRLFDEFSRSFGGGFSGRPLKPVSLSLAAAAARHYGSRPAGAEFHVLRTGGVEARSDLLASQEAGVALSGWFTGYFESLSQHGHDLYRDLWG